MKTNFGLDGDIFQVNEHSEFNNRVSEIRLKSNKPLTKPHVDIITEAIKNKCEYVATFDQDSAVDDGLISKLLNQFFSN